MIKRQRRESLSAVHQQAFFYVLYGNVYQAPSLHACLTARADKTLHHLEAAFAQLTRDLEPLAAGQRVATRLKRPRGDGGDVERDAVKALVQPPLVSPARARTIRNVDRIVLKVLERCAHPHSRAMPRGLCALTDGRSFVLGARARRSADCRLQPAGACRYEVPTYE